MAVTFHCVRFLHLPITEETVWLAGRYLNERTNQYLCAYVEKSSLARAKRADMGPLTSTIVMP
jgi:hypothetical protein